MKPRPIPRQETEREVIEARDAGNTHILEREEEKEALLMIHIGNNVRLKEHQYKKKKRFKEKWSLLIRYNISIWRTKKQNKISPLLTETSVTPLKSSISFNLKYYSRIIAKLTRFPPPQLSGLEGSSYLLMITQHLLSVQSLLWYLNIL